MNTLYRALASIRRNTLKSLILFSFTFVLGVFMSIILLTHYASQQAQQNVIHNMNPRAIIGRDWEAIRLRQLYDDSVFRYRPILPPLSMELIYEVAALPYVARYEYNMERRMFSNLELYHPDACGILLAEPIRLDLGEIFYIRGVQKPHFAELDHLVIDLVAGRTFTNEELELSKPVAIISEDLARNNQLTIGSTVALESILFNPELLFDGSSFQTKNKMDSISYEVEIIGTFRVAADIANAEFHESTNWWMLRKHKNRIYVPNGFVQQVDQETMALGDAIGFSEILERKQEIDFEDLSWDEGFGLYGALYNTIEHHIYRVYTFFILEDPQYMMPFIEAVEPLLPEYYIVQFEENYFHVIIHALQYLEETSAILLPIIIGAILLIFSLLIALYMRHRKQEVGIYLALGMKKVQVGLQIICETLSVSTPALILSLIVGSIIGRNISEQMLLNDLIRNEGEKANTAVLFYRFGLGGDQAGINILLDNYEKALTFRSSMLFMIVALVIIFISIVVPLYFSLLQNPKKIMM